MLYDIRADIVDPASGEVVAEKGEMIADPDRQKTVDIIVREANDQYQAIGHKPAYRTRPMPGSLIVEDW